MYQQTDRAFSGLTQRLLERISARVGEAVLDIGCGAGELSLAIARARSRARVIGLDLSPDLIEAAHQRALNHANVEFELGDAATWQHEGFAPDLLVSRHGVMFFDEPLDAFTHLRAISASGSSLVFSCFRSPRENRWASDFSELLGSPPPSDPHAPGPFAFADPQYVEPLLAAAGWQGVDFEPVDFAYIAGKGDDPVGEATGFFSRIGPAAVALRALDDDARHEALDRISALLENHRSGDLVALAAAAWIVTARAS
jgi:SAM-dependent methyltransferase